jgi:hypothetical protein
MSKKNWAVWGLVAVLAAAVLGSSGVLFVSYQNQLPEERRWVTLLPRAAWSFGPDNLAALAFTLRLCHAADVQPPKRYRLGFVSVRVE